MCVFCSCKSWRLQGSSMTRTAWTNTIFYILLAMTLQFASMKFASFVSPLLHFLSLFFSTLPLTLDFDVAIGTARPPGPELDQTISKKRTNHPFFYSVFSILPFSGYLWVFLFFFFWRKSKLFWEIMLHLCDYFFFFLKKKWTSFATKKALKKQK